MLLGQDFRRRHQRTLPAAVDGDRRSQRGHHRLARAHVTLQQAVHGRHPRQIVCDLLADAPLRARQGKGQGRQQAFVQAAGRRRQRRGAQPVAFALGLQLRQLLGQQLFGLQALPGRMPARFQIGQRHVRWRVVQKGERLTQIPRGKVPVFFQQISRNGFRQVRPRRRSGHGPTQPGLGQSGNGRIHRRQGVGQGAAGRADRRMHHGPARETATQFATHAHPVAHRQRLLLGRVEVEETQQAGVATIVHRHQQLPARPKTHLAGRHHRLDLHLVALAHVAKTHDAGLVLVAQRQMQCEVDVAHQPELAQGFLGGAQGIDIRPGRRSRRDGRHGAHCPCPGGCRRCSSVHALVAKAILSGADD